MHVRGFFKAGHPPTLFCSFLYFDISFMVWVLLGALANAIVRDPQFQLNETQSGLIVAIPLLGGAILRLILGGMTDHIGARKTGIIGLSVTMIPLALGWLWADSFEKLLVVGLMLGVAGASFAVALPLASRWYPPQFQGLAMGIAGAGNSGTALATFFAPMIAVHAGWHAVLGLSMIPIGLTLLIFVLFAKESPNRPAPKSLVDYLKVLGHVDTWWFCLFYSVTFGGFVGLASFLSRYFQKQHELSDITAGTFATICVISGSFLRPVGGYLADRFGGIHMLMTLYFGVVLSMIGLGLFPDSLPVATLLMFLCMGFLGMGNGSVFQLVPLRFPREIGVITGIVGAAGGLGGFFLPTLLGYLKDHTNSYSGGFYAFGAMSMLCVITLLIVSRGWQGVFVGRGGKAVVQGPTATMHAINSDPIPQQAAIHKPEPARTAV